SHPDLFSIASKQLRKPVDTRFFTEKLCSCNLAPLPWKRNAYQNNQTVAFHTYWRSDHAAGPPGQWPDRRGPHRWDDFGRFRRRDPRCGGHCEERENRPEPKSFG